MSAIEKLQTAKANADSTQADRQNYASYVDAMRECGWTDEDVSEYREEVERIMKFGTDEEKRDASVFWKTKIREITGSAAGCDARIKRSIRNLKLQEAA